MVRVEARCSACGNFLLIGAFVVLGSVAFLALGYVIASFARTEDAANGMVSFIRFPMMFLSGMSS